MSQLTASQELLQVVDLVAVADLARGRRDPVLGAEPGADQAGLHDAVDMHHVVEDTVSLLQLPVPTGGLLATRTPGVCSAAVLLQTLIIN